ncbi:hypothetical protein ACTPC6_01275 [Clostridioides difficile]
MLSFDNKCAVVSKSMLLFSLYDHFGDLVDNMEIYIDILASIQISFINSMAELAKD